MPVPLRGLSTPPDPGHGGDATRRSNAFMPICRLRIRWVFPAAVHAAGDCGGKAGLACAPSSGTLAPSSFFKIFFGYSHPPPPSVDTTKTRSAPQRVRMSSGERPIGAAKGKQSDTEALCQAPPPPSLRTPNVRQKVPWKPGPGPGLQTLALRQRLHRKTHGAAPFACSRPMHSCGNRNVPAGRLRATTMWGQTCH